MELEHRPEDWHRIHPLCNDNVQELGYDAYFNYVEDGFEQARDALRDHPETVPLPDIIEAVHRTIFHRVYDFAGKFQDKQDAKEWGIEIRGDFRKRPAFPSQIEPELKLLRDREALSLFSTAKTETQVAQAIAFHAAKFGRIHPFREGNTRVNLLLVEKQVEELLERPMPEFTKDDYRNAQIHALRRQDLGPLSRVLTGVDLGARFMSPHTIHLQGAFRVERQLEHNIDVTFLAPDTDIAYALLREPIDPKKLSPSLGAFEVQHPDSGKTVSVAANVQDPNRVLEQKQELEEERNRHLGRGKDRTR